MSPIDYRTATFDLIKDSLAGKRRLVYDALRTLGPQTTRALAQLAHMDLLTVRPRITELIDLGLVELVQEGLELEAGGLREESSSPEPQAASPSRRPKEGTYRALSMEEAMRVFNERHTDAVKEEQLSLKV